MKCGLLGGCLAHSYSPQIHKFLGSYDYALFEKKPEEVEDFLLRGDFHSINVTIPYKKTALPYCQALTPQAQRLGAVNTLVRRPDGSLLGHNTDYFGFRSMAQRTKRSFAGRKALVLGSGGASNTVCAVLEELGSRVVVISRTGPDNYENIQNHADATVIVNTTPVGTYPHTGVSPVDLEMFPRLEAALDLTYNPSRTQLLLDAEKRGLVTQNGLWMLVAQAWESAQWFLGAPLPQALIEETHDALRRQMENIVLIGMPGCGKTTVGKLLAQQLEKEFVDADAVIEATAGCSIPEIFQNQGEAGFRKLESQALSQLGKRSGQVIATGGGCVTRPENYPYLHQNGTILWLQRDISVLPTQGRPLSAKGNLDQMYAIRQPMYAAFADGVIDGNGPAEQVAQRCIEMLYGK